MVLMPLDTYLGRSARLIALKQIEGMKWDKEPINLAEPGLAFRRQMRIA